MRRLALGLIGLAVGLAAGAAAPQPAAQPALPAAGEPHLPPAPPPVAPLRRGPDGQIEAVDPEAVRRAGQALCDKGAICVGPGQRYRTLAAGLAAAQDGALVELVGGTYRESASIARSRLTLRGVAGRPHIDCAHAALAGGRACLLLAGDKITLDNLELSGAAPAEGTDAAAACIANEPGRDFHLSRILCHDSENGIVAHGGTIEIAESEFYNNGAGKGSGNAAFDQGCLLTVRGSTFRDARAGAELVSRCSGTTISDSSFRSAASGVMLDLPDGGETLVYRSRFEKVLDAGSGDIIRFAEDDCRNPGTVVFKEVRIVNSRLDTALRNYDRCRGDAIVLERVTFDGVPPREIGYILTR